MVIIVISHIYLVRGEPLAQSCGMSEPGSRQTLVLARVHKLTCVPFNIQGKLQKKNSRFDHKNKLNSIVSIVTN